MEAKPMSANGNVVAAVAQERTKTAQPGFLAPRGWLDRNFYFLMALLIPCIVVSGFRISVGPNLVHATVPRPTILWFHAAAMSAWVLLYLAQSMLVRLKKVRWHRTFGWAVAGLGVVIVPLGVATGLAMGHFHAVTLHEAGAEVFECVSFFDMLAFGTFFTLAIVWRRKPDLHRRLLFIATCGLLDAAFGRFDYIFNHHLYYVCVDSVILLGVLRDLLIDRRIHKVYLYALPLLAVGQYLTVQMYARPVGWWVHLAHAWMA
jgi:hypothetical protein